MGHLTFALCPLELASSFYSVNYQFGLTNSWQSLTQQGSDPPPKDSVKILSDSLSFSTSCFKSSLSFFHCIMKHASFVSSVEVFSLFLVQLQLTVRSIVQTDSFIFVLTFSQRGELFVLHSDSWSHSNHIHHSGKCLSVLEYLEHLYTLLW